MVWSTIKNWLNIGGVKLTVEDFEPTIYVGRNMLAGKAVMTAKSDKEVLSLKCMVIQEHTEKKGDEHKTDTFTLGQQEFLETFAIAAGETREIPFSIDYHLDEKMEHQGGVTGAVGKLGSLALGKSDSYYFVAECDVKGAVVDPSVRTRLKVGRK